MFDLEQPTYPETSAISALKIGELTMYDANDLVQDPTELLRHALPPACSACTPMQQKQVDRIGWLCEDPRIGGIQKGVAKILADFGCTHL